MNGRAYELLGPTGVGFWRPSSQYSPSPKRPQQRHRHERPLEVRVNGKVDHRHPADRCQAGQDDDQRSAEGSGAKGGVGDVRRQQPTRDDEPAHYVEYPPEPGGEAGDGTLDRLA
jgi:hypothetical protein